MYTIIGLYWSECSGELDSFNNVRYVDCSDPLTEQFIFTVNDEQCILIALDRKSANYMRRYMHNVSKLFYAPNMRSLTWLTDVREHIANYRQTWLEADKTQKPKKKWGKAAKQVKEGIE